LKSLKEKKQGRDMRKPLKVEWIILLGAIIAFSCLYLYNDLAFSSAGGLRVWNCIAEGKLSLFYWSNYPGVEGSVLPDGSAGGSYDFLIYSIFAVYNFPLWIWEKITGLSFLSFYPTRLYLKGIIWLFSGFSALLIYKIAVLCGSRKENAIWGPVLFLTSSLFYTAEITIGGYDIISVTFSLLGIYGFLKKNDKCFLTSFAVAIATKLFAFWLFIPLLLLREKKIWKLAVKTLLALSAIIIPKLYFALGSQAAIAKGVQLGTETLNAATAVSEAPMVVNDVIAHSDIIDEALFPTDYTAIFTFLSIDNLPLVFVGMFAVWICCYFIKRELTGIEVIYLCAVVMSIFMVTVKLHPYWCILIVPYIILLIILNPGRIKENFLLELLISAGYVFNKAILYSWCFSLAQIERMFGPNFRFNYDSEEINLGAYGLESIVSKLSEKIGIAENNIAHIFSALFIAGIVLFLYFNYPEKITDGEVSIGETEGIRKSMLWRFLFTIFVGCLPIIGLLLYLSPYSWS